MKHINIIRLLFLAYALPLYAVRVMAQPKQTVVHPRLFANDERIKKIQSQTDEVSKQLLFIIKSDAEKRLSDKPIVYPDNASNMGASRNVQGRIISLALAYRLFDDKRFLARAKEELLQLAALSDWGVGHFLDVGEASLAAGIGYDWLYHELSVAERRTVVNAIKNNALLPSLRAKESENNSSWVNGNFNWNPVCHGGLIVGALAISESEPELSKQIVDRGVKNIPVAGDAYSPDGAFAEGPSYWSYGTSFYVLAIEALRTALGNSAGLEKIPGFLETADYNNQMVGATGEEYNYSDYHLENLNEPVMLWFANETHRPDLIKDELRDIKKLEQVWIKKNLRQSGANPPSSEAPQEDKVGLGLREAIQQSRHTPLEILWWNPALIQQAAPVRANRGAARFPANQNATKPAALHWTATGLMPIGVMRSSWDDTMATFVAIKGGTPDNSHGHMDAGSFILEANGVRWAIDLGTESYDKMRAAKLDLWSYAQNSTRWTTFRCGPEGHNILRFNNERQLITGNGAIKEIPSAKGTMGNEADLTSLYANEAAKVVRTMLLHPDRSVSIHDEWTTKDNDAGVSFQWLTKAKVTKNTGGLLLQQNGQSLQLKIEQPTTGVTIDIEDVSQPRNPQDSPNPGLSRIVLKQKTAPQSKGCLLIKVIPGESGL